MQDLLDPLEMLCKSDLVIGVTPKADAIPVLGHVSKLPYDAEGEGETSLGDLILLCGGDRSDHTGSGGGGWTVAPV